MNDVICVIRTATAMTIQSLFLWVVSTRGGASSDISLVLTTNFCYPGFGNFKSLTATELVVVYYHRGNSAIAEKMQ